MERAVGTRSLRRWETDGGYTFFYGGGSVELVASDDEDDVCHFGLEIGRRLNNCRTHGRKQIGKQYIDHGELLSFPPAYILVKVAALVIPSLR